MSDTIVTLEDASSRLPELATHVSRANEPALILKDGSPLVRIIPAASAAHSNDELIGFLRQWRSEHPEPDEGLAEAVEETRKFIQPLHDPWE